MSAGSDTSMVVEITDEFANAELKDVRRNRRLTKVVTALLRGHARRVDRPASGVRGATLCGI